jgi:hypothetical protein
MDIVSPPEIVSPVVTYALDMRGGYALRAFADCLEPF